MTVTGQSRDWEAEFRDRILPRFAARTPADTAPRWIFVCGQPGSGKSGCVRRLMAELGEDRTQLICSDSLTGMFPDLLTGPEDTFHQAALAEFRGTVRRGYIDRLVDHATRLGAHVLWERPNTGDIEQLALVARALGYRVDCIMLAVPLVESWLATMLRSLEKRRLGDPVVFDIAWASARSNSRRWPACLARIEASAAVDRITVLDRDGTACFQNRVEPAAGRRNWAEQPFAFESLVIERARPRTPGDMQRLIADWLGVMADPDIAFRNHPAWPWDSIAGFRQILADLAADPGTGFDLNAPGDDALAASRWIDRLRTTLDDILAGPEAAGQPGLAARAERLVALAARVAGQPIR